MYYFNFTSHIFDLFKVVLHFVRTLYRLPDAVFSTLIQTAIAALAIQERYALVSACTFLVRQRSKIHSLRSNAIKTSQV